MFQLSFKNIQSIFHELLAGQVRQNCRATLVIPPGTSVATIVTICCNHRDGEYFLHRISRKLGSTATSTLITMLLPLTNYISGTENETQRALLGHTDGNIEMRSPSAAAMLTMVAAATIVRFPPVIVHDLYFRSQSHIIYFMFIIFHISYVFCYYIYYHIHFCVRAVLGLTTVSTTWCIVSVNITYEPCKKDI